MTRQSASALFRSVGMRLGILPMQVVVTELQKRGVDLGRLRALDVFAGTGERTSRHYAPLVGSLEAWELEPSFEPELRRNLPRAHVKITDSYEEVHRAEGNFDLIFVDNSASPHGGHSEHFDLFPQLFRLLSDEAILVLHVLPKSDKLTRRGYPQLFNDEHLAQRRSFYQTDRPEHIPLKQLAGHYRALLEEHGFSPQWHFFVRRWEVRYVIPVPVNSYYLAFNVKRQVRLGTATTESSVSRERDVTEAERAS
jgi:hypothetical protein